VGKLCTVCGEKYVSNPDHELCNDCWLEKEDEEFRKHEMETGDDLKEVNTVYIFFQSERLLEIGNCPDLDKKTEEMKTKFPMSKLVYFRDFIKEFDAKRYAVWLKTLSPPELDAFLEEFKKRLRKLGN
jgi:hypothetical protein